MKSIFSGECYNQPNIQKYDPAYVHPAYDPAICSGFMHSILSLHILIKNIIL